MKIKRLSDEDRIDLTDPDIHCHINVIEKLNVDEAIDRQYPNAPQSVEIMRGYVKHLRDAGLDIGEGERKYGVKMPIVEKHAQRRDLIIFRRK